MSGFALLILVPLGAGAALLWLFRLRRYFGIAPMCLYLGSIQYLQTVLATTASVRLSEGLSVPLGSGALFATALIGVLVTYSREGTSTARALVVAIVTANVLIMLIASSAYFLLVGGSVGFDPGLRGFMVVDPQIFMVGTAVFVIDCFLLVMLFETLLALAPRVPAAVHAVITLVAVLTFDGLAFGYGSFWAHPGAGGIVLGLIVGKGVSAIPFGVLAGVYLTYVEPPRAGQPDHPGPQPRDVLAILSKGRSFLELEDRLLDTEARYERLFHSAPAGIGVLERDQAGIWRFSAANTALLDMLAYPSADALGIVDTRKLLLSPWEGERLVGALEAGVPFEHEETWVRADDASVILRVLGSPLKQDSGPPAIQVFAQDVTERRMLQGQLRHAQKMEAVGQLTAGLAHDFNNLLTSVVASADLIREDIEAGTNVAPELADDIGAAGRRGADLVRKLMAFSRKSTLTTSDVDVGVVLEEFAAMMRRLLPESVEVVTEPPGELPQVDADPGALQQILVNLATNARDAMPEGGTLRVRASEFVIDEAFRAERGWGRLGAYVCISVEDDGWGMDEQTTLRAFDPFFTTKPTGRGTGLGLAMTYGLMKQQGGHVEIHSEIGRGTTVRLYVPAHTGRRI